MFKLYGEVNSLKNTTIAKSQRQTNPPPRTKTPKNKKNKEKDKEKMSD